MTYSGKPNEFYEAQADKLKAKYNEPKIYLTVRDIMETLGYTSTTPAMNAIQNMIEIGRLEFEQRGRRKRYYLK